MDREGSDDLNIDHVEVYQSLRR